MDPCSSNSCSSSHLYLKTTLWSQWIAWLSERQRCMQEGHLGVFVVAGRVVVAWAGWGAADIVKWRRLRGESPVQKRVREGGKSRMALVSGARSWWSTVASVGMRKKSSKTAGVGETGVGDWRSVCRSISGPSAWERVRFQLGVWKLPGWCMFDWKDVLIDFSLSVLSANIKNTYLLP